MSKFIEDFTEKTSLNGNDLIVIADSQSSNINKKTKFSFLNLFFKNKYYLKYIYMII